MTATPLRCAAGAAWQAAALAVCMNECRGLHMHRASSCAALPAAAMKRACRCCCLPRIGAHPLAAPLPAPPPPALQKLFDSSRFNYDTEDEEEDAAADQQQGTERGNAAATAAAAQQQRRRGGGGAAAAEGEPHADAAEQPVDIVLPPPRGVRVKSAEFVKSSVSVDQCPPARYPEFAGGSRGGCLQGACCPLCLHAAGTGPPARRALRLCLVRGCRRGSLELAATTLPAPASTAVIGRSNVGKSSLINMLTGRSSLAMVSKTPGALCLLRCLRCCTAGLLGRLATCCLCRLQQREGRTLLLPLPSPLPTAAPHLPGCLRRQDALHQPLPDQQRLVPRGPAGLRVSEGQDLGGGAAGLSRGSAQQPCTLGAMPAGQAPCPGPAARL